MSGHEPFGVERVAGVLAGDAACVRKLSVLCARLGLCGSQWYVWRNSLVAKRKTELQVLTHILRSWTDTDPSASLPRLHLVLLQLGLDTSAAKLEELEEWAGAEKGGTDPGLPCPAQPQVRP